VSDRRATNFAARLEATARLAGDRAALVWDGGTLTYRELDERAGVLAGALTARGLQPGDRLAIAMPNGWPFVVALLGGLKAALTVAPLDPLLKSDERAAIVGDLVPALVLEDVPAAASAPPARREALPTAAPALILYTSGSTGRPKGAVLSHAAVTFAEASWAGPVMALDADDVVLAALPLSHSFGLNGALLAPLLAGCTVRLVERFAADSVADIVAREPITVLPAVATMFRRLLDVPRFAGGGNLRLALSGAAPLPWDLAQEWRARTGVRLLRGYGSTEMFRPISYLAGDSRDVPDSAGRAVPGVELRVVDDAGQALPPAEIGELQIRSPAAMDGYLGAPDETRAVLSGGWFSTGDLASIDGDGFVRITGRKRERILRAGYSVFPSEVEAVLLAHPDVTEAAVIGAPDAELGEEVVAYVVVRTGASLAADVLVAHCRERLAAFKYPRRITLVPSLPRSPTGKILKAQLRVIYS
jgi:long-chain acyl-CoA synthetase